MKNVGSFDKRMRALAGLCLFVCALFTMGLTRWLLLTGALALTITSYLEYCPVWHGIGVDSRGKKR